ncbi:MAG TPA: AsmA-like C-terminal region-containing protein [Sphingobacteriaceae bacterium]
MRRTLFILLKAAGILAGLIAVIWIGAAAYVNTHKKEVLALITRLVNQNVNGTVTIESVEPALIKGFPGISIQLNSVRLVDSLQQGSRSDILRAREVFVAVNAFSILSGKPRIQDLSVENGSIYLYTDTSGHSNSRLFKKKSRSGNKINRITLRNVRVTLDNRLKGKLYSFSFRKLQSRIRYQAGGWKAEVALNGRINDLTFNVLKGSYAKNKIIRTDLNLSYRYDTHLLTVPRQLIRFDNDSFHIGGALYFAPDRSDYTLNITAPGIRFRNAAGLLTPRLKRTMAGYDFRKPIRIHADIKGRLRGKNDPLVKVNVKIRNNTFLFRKEEVRNCSFDAEFTNEVVKGLPRKDPNSRFAFYGLKGEWHTLPFRADTVYLVNLKQPVIEGKFRASFPLTRVNEVSEGQTFVFRKGTADVNVLYKAPFNAQDEGKSYIYGTVSIRNGGFTYTPRNLPFDDLKVSLDFRGEDLFLRNVSVRSGRSQLLMEGSLRNFLNLYYESPQDIVLDWKISSPMIDLGQFTAFLAKRKAVPASGVTPPARIFARLDRVLAQAEIRMNLNVEKLTYKKFLARNLRSDLTMGQNGIALKNISLQHAHGRVRLHGLIDQRTQLNRITMQGRLEDVDVNRLFYAFEDFGQKGISYTNLRGIFSSDVDVRGSMAETGQLIPQSVYGTVKFRLRNGALVNFPPMQKIGDLAFRNRNFSNITFADLTNTLVIQGSKVHIRPMLIRSNVLNLFVEGTYGFSKGTDIQLRVPLRNPEKDKYLADSLKRKNVTKGIVLNLRAVEQDGKIRIRLGKGDKEETSAQENGQ